MNSELERYWRRRVAAMRIIHVWYVSSTVMASSFLLMALVFVSIQLRAHAANYLLKATLFGLWFSILIFLVALAVALARRWAFVRSYQRHLGPRINLTNFSTLENLPTELAALLGRSRQEIETRTIVNPKSSPAQIFEGPNKTIYILVRFDFLPIAKRDPALLSGILWHELGHYIQWDTKFGYWSLRLIDRMTLWLVSLGCGGLVDIGSIALARYIYHVPVTKMQAFGMLLELLSILCLFCLFWFLGLYRRFSEHNADLTATLAGYGEPLAAYFSAMQPSKRNFMTLIGFHPSPRARIKAIRTFCHRLANGRPQHVSPVEQSSTIYPRLERLTPVDYVYALCVYVAARWLLFLAPIAAISGGVLSQSFLSLLKDPDFDRAILEYDGAVGLLPKATVHKDLGILLGNEGKWDAAITEEREAIRLDPRVAEAHEDLGWALAGKGEWDAAIAEEREAIRLNPQLADAHEDLGWALAAKGEWDSAIAEEREAIRLNPKLVRAHRELGRALENKNEWDPAIAEEREAIRLDPNPPRPHEYLGWALAAKGEWDAAIAEEREAIRLDPNAARAYWMLGFSFSQKGDRGSANAAYTRACQLDPAHFTCQGRLRN